MSGNHAQEGLKDRFAAAKNSIPQINWLARNCPNSLIQIPSPRVSVVSLISRFHCSHQSESNSESESNWNVINRVTLLVVTYFHLRCQCVFWTFRYTVLIACLWTLVASLAWIAFRFSIPDILSVWFQGNVLFNPMPCASKKIYVLKLAYHESQAKFWFLETFKQVIFMYSWQLYSIIWNILIVLILPLSCSWFLPVDQHKGFHEGITYTSLSLSIYLLYVVNVHAF